MDDLRAGNQGKRRAYLIVLACGLVAAVYTLTKPTSSPGVTQIPMAIMIALGAVLLVGMLTRRLPMRWVDLLVFSILAVGLLFPVLAWHFDARALESGRDVLAVLLWAGLLLPLAFVVFGTRGGVAGSVVSIVLLAVLARPVLVSSALGTQHRSFTTRRYA